ncbi:putative structural protein [Polaromonas phage Tiera]|nr:putative structural protein [Polaromonas phage Tiera]
MADEFAPVDGFDTDINYSYMTNKQDSTSSLASTITGGAVASVVEAGVGLWNSLPGTPEVETRDLLGRINNNALQVYNENPEAIQAAGFIAGSFLPMGLAMKGMGLMRAGAKGMNWFSTAGRVAEEAKVAKMLAEGAGATKDYRNAVRALYAKTGVNQAIDAVAAEAMVVGMMHNTPMMEDYLEDPVKNFGISVALGGVIGTGIGIVGEHFVVKTAAAKLSEEAFGALKGQIGKVPANATNQVGMVVLNKNVENLTKMLEDGKLLGKRPENDLTMSMAEKMKTIYSAEMDTVFKDMVAPEVLAKLDAQQVLALRDTLTDTMGMIGVQKVSAVKPENLIYKKPVLNGRTIGELTNSAELMTAGKEAVAEIPAGAPTLKVKEYKEVPGVESPVAPFYGTKTLGEVEDILKNLQSKGKVNPAITVEVNQGWLKIYTLEEVAGTAGKAGKAAVPPAPQKAVLFPETGMFGLVSDLKHYAGANALYKSSDEAAAAIKRNFGKFPDHDTILALQARSSAELQADYVGAMKLVDKMTPAQFEKLVISPTDQPMIAAVKAKLAKGEPEFAGKKVKLADSGAYTQAVMEENTASAGAQNFSKIDNNIGSYDLMEIVPNSPEAKLLRQWKGGDVHPLREGAAEYTRAGFAATSTRPEEKQKLYDTFKKIYESKESTQLRDDFRAVADSEGYVLLWRGTKNPNSRGARGAARSYSTQKEKAGQFGNERLYRVLVEDIVAGFTDIGSGSKNVEIVVMEGERLPITLSTAGKQKLMGAITPATKQVDIQELNNLAFANTQREIDSLFANGVPSASIAIKTNTPLDLVEQYRMGGSWEDAFDNYNFRGNGNSNIINTLEDADKVMDPLKAPLVLEGNQLKAKYTQSHANANNKAMKDMNSQIVENSMRQSKNPFVHELADVLHLPASEGGNRQLLDMVFDRVSKATNEAAGNFFTQSADMAMRKMGDLGPVVSYIGKEVERVTNAAKNAVVEPIRSAMIAIVPNAVEVVEFNTFVQVNAGLKGWRGVVNGKLMQRATDDAGKALMNEDGTYALKAVQYQGKDYQIVSKNVLDTIEKMQASSEQLLELSNTAQRIKGSSNVPDIGLWVPSFNPLNKEIAYVHDMGADKTSIIWANNPAELEQMVRDYKTNLTAQGKDNIVKVYRKGLEQQQWSRMNGRLDVMNMTVADSSMMKGGSSAIANIRNDAQIFTDLAEGYNHYISSKFRELADLSMSDITHELDTMSKVNNFGFDGQPLGYVKKLIDKPNDAAAKVKNLLLGQTNLGEYTGWKDASSLFETGLSMGVNTSKTIWDAAVKPLTTRFFGKKALTPEVMGKMDYEKMAKDLEAAGIPNPWAGFDKEAAKFYGLATLTDSADTSKRIVYAGNALAATFALRVGELAQPLVNAMSLPVLTALATAMKMPESFMGVAKGTAKASAVQVMFDGARAMNDPQFAHLGKLWESKGYFTPMISEVNDTMKASRSFNKGAIQSIEKMLDSTMIQVMSKPADLSESFTRKLTMYTGAMLGKRLYPELDDIGLTIFARDFMDKAVGNFHAAQRPVFFQGTAGVALGLFQTYSLTLGQNIYRHLEMKNYKALGTAGLLQSGIFGIGSMPGFNAVSQLIGANFSDNHTDLVTGTYRDLPDQMAQSVLYGLPSLAGLGTHTRGDSNFRIPGLTGDNVVAINFAKQAAQAVGTIGTAMGEGTGMPQAFAEALSLQSLSRPLARGAELASGYSVTRAGNTVQTPDEVYTTTGVMARVLGVRPITETRLREADNLNRYYGALDREARQKVVKSIRTGIRSGDFDDGKLAGYAEEYFRKGGTPTGWRSAVNTAIGKTETSGKEIFIDKLKPDSPLQFMINNMDGE